MSAIVKCRNQIIKRLCLYVSWNRKQHLYLLPGVHRWFVELTDHQHRAEQSLQKFARKKNPQNQKPHCDWCCKFCSSRSLSRAFNISCCHGELLLLSLASGGSTSLSPRARKNNWCLGRSKVAEFFPAFCHFHLKGHSWLSSRICDAAGEANYSDRKTMQGVRHCFKQDPFFRLLPFSSPFCRLFDALSAWNLSEGRTRDPSVVNETPQWVFGSRLLRHRLFNAEVTLPVWSYGIASDVIWAPVLFRPFWQHISVESKRERKLK